MAKIFRTLFLAIVVVFTLFLFFLKFTQVDAADFSSLPILLQKAKTTIEDIEKTINQNQALKTLLDKNSSLKNLISSAKDFIDNFDVFANSMAEIDKNTGIFSNPEGFKALIKDSAKEIENIAKKLSNGADPSLLIQAKKEYDNVMIVVGTITKLSNAIEAGKKSLTALDNFQKSYNEVKSSLNLKNIKINFDLTVSGKKKLEDIVKGELENLYHKFKREIDQAGVLLGRIALCQTGIQLDPGCANKEGLIKELENIIKTTLPKAVDELINHISGNIKIEASFDGFSDFAGDISAAFKITNIQVKKQQSGTEITFSLEGAGTIESGDKVQWIIKYKGKVYDFNTPNPKINLSQSDLFKNLYAQIAPPSPPSFPSPSSSPPSNPNPPSNPSPPASSPSNPPSNPTPPDTSDISAQAAVIKTDKAQPLMVGGLNEGQAGGKDNPSASVKDDCDTKNRGQACTANNGQSGRCNYIPETTGKNLWCKPVPNGCEGKSIDDECEINGKKGKCADYQKPELLCRVVGGAGRTFPEPIQPAEPNTPSTVALDQDCKNGILENGGLIPCRGTSGCPCTFCHFFYLIQKIINFITLKFVPAVAILLVVIGGGMYLFNFGNTNRVKQGTDILIGVAVGILIIYGAWLIINTILIRFVNPEAIQDFPERWFSITCPIK